MSSWNEFCQSVKRTANRAADMIGQSVDIATLQVKLSAAEGKLDDAYTALGRLAYRRFTEQEISDGAMQKAMDDVAECIKACDALKAQISKAKEAKNTEQPNVKE